MAGDLLVFGRLAHGEIFKSGYLRDSWKVMCNGRLVWTDASSAGWQCDLCHDRYGWVRGNGFRSHIHVMLPTTPVATSRLRAIFWLAVRRDVRQPVLTAFLLSDSFHRIQGNCGLPSESSGPDFAREYADCHRICLGSGIVRAA